MENPQDPPAKNWCYTLNNYESVEEVASLNPLCHYHIFGKEVGESGTPHLQGYATFIKKTRLSALKKLVPRAHWEKSKGTVTQNYNYCSKDKNFVEYGERPLERGAAAAIETKRRHADVIAMAKDGRMDELEQQYPSEFLRYHATIKRIRQDHPRSFEAEFDTTGEWYSGKSGHGKSHYVRDTYKSSLYKKLCNKWWDGYNGEDFVLIEDFDTNHSCLGHHLKIWGDKYDFPAEVKGTTIVIRPKKIIVTSQYEIHEIFEDEKTREAIQRRFKQYHVNDRRIFDQSKFNPNNYL